ncbi:hypothetical protein [Nocardia farcinica]|uniref:hypothetical protein n=1 Tax=Nocardia farcinica TaxID=37329 RepID=UPI001894A5FB|nr:hypothetical protein [Nocardia farcinica]MBF6231299.1 hypothetical protein [Nocardia farcinica]
MTRKVPPTLVGGTIPAVGLLGKLSNPLRAAQLRNLAKLLHTASPRPSATTPIRPRHLDQRFAPETLAEIAASYECGSSTNQLCKQYDLSKGSLMKILQDHGIKTTALRPASSP